MGTDVELIVGEFSRVLDERHRLSLPGELLEQLAAPEGRCILAKERPGCLSLWSKPGWQEKLDEGVALVRGKIRAGKLEGRLGQVQALGRLLSTRHREVQIAARGRLLVPEGFRQFLGVEQGGEILVVGAAVCVELWRPDAWLDYLQRRIPRFRQLFDKLSS
ncbi:MAG: division/cell wall cluster transcriptional repressor MraZ [Planctomycetales bacterium]|nr:division/cell wall cluster transcriptional repressor MraZ [Planctomycetales bacterium]NIO35673.1 division/cell wall cluster transcriptional repressor MraZ [Planctomycetales bacterium]